MTRVEAEETDIHNSLLSSGFTRIDDTETKTMLRNYKKTCEYTRTLIKDKDIHIFLLQRGVTRAAGMSRVGRSGLGLGESRRTRPSRWEIMDMVTLVMMSRLAYAQAFKWGLVTIMGNMETRVLRIMRRKEGWRGNALNMRIVRTWTPGWFFP